MAFANPDNNAGIPLDFVIFELMIEWGLTTEQFNNESYEDIMKIIEYRKMKAEGENVHNKKMK